jgi:aspartyl-tRNA(Asn)/glutamyl-tRNA(Gln) amidotransferase subunit A
VRRSLRRIELRDNAVGAFATVFREQALQEAVARDRAAPRGPLHGVPVAVKDNVDTVGTATTAGVLYRARCRPVHDADLIRTLRAAGGVVIGKTTMHELGFGGTSQNAYHGPCRNPWDLSRTPGGSSGGSASAVAAGMVPLAIGTDTGGSVRIPAAVTGVYGLRPTPRLVSMRGVVPLAWSLDTVGLFARTATDTATLLDALAGTATAAELRRGATIAGLRVGIPRSFFFDDVEPQVQDAVRRMASLLEHVGAQLLQVDLPGAEALFEKTRALLWSEAFAAHGRALRDHGDSLPPRVRARLAAGAAVTGADYARSREWIRGWRGTVANVLCDVDVVLSPTTGATAPTVEEAEAVEDARTLTRYTHPWSFAIGPSMSVPCGFDSCGLPIGAHLFGRPGEEKTLLCIAAAYEQVTDWTTRRPALDNDLENMP